MPRNTMTMATEQFEYDALPPNEQPVPYDAIAETCLAHIPGMVRHGSTDTAIVAVKILGEAIKGTDIGKYRPTMVQLFHEGNPYHVLIPHSHDVAQQLRLVLLSSDDQEYIGLASEQLLTTAVPYDLFNETVDTLVAMQSPAAAHELTRAIATEYHAKNYGTRPDTIARINHHLERIIEALAQNYPQEAAEALSVAINNLPEHAHEARRKIIDALALSDDEIAITALVKQLTVNKGSKDYQDLVEQLAHNSAFRHERIAQQLVDNLESYGKDTLMRILPLELIANMPGLAKALEGNQRWKFGQAVGAIWLLPGEHEAQRQYLREVALYDQRKDVRAVATYFASYHQKHPHNTDERRNQPRSTKLEASGESSLRDTAVALIQTSPVSVRRTILTRAASVTSKTPGARDIAYVFSVCAPDSIPAFFYAHINDHDILQGILEAMKHLNRKLMKPLALTMQTEDQKDPQLNQPSTNLIASITGKRSNLQ